MSEQGVSLAAPDGHPSTGPAGATGRYSKEEVFTGAAGVAGRNSKEEVFKCNGTRYIFLVFNILQLTAQTPGVERRHLDTRPDSASPQHQVTSTLSLSLPSPPPLRHRGGGGREAAAKGIASLLPCPISAVGRLVPRK